jgi:hypothetical protein
MYACTFVHVRIRMYMYIRTYYANICTKTHVHNIHTCMHTYQAVLLTPTVSSQFLPPKLSTRKFLSPAKFSLSPAKTSILLRRGSRGWTKMSLGVNETSQETSAFNGGRVSNFPAKIAYVPSCVYVCVCVCVFVLHVLHSCMYVHVYLCVYACTCVHVRMYVYTFVFNLLREVSCKGLGVCMYVVCMYICKYTYMHAHSPSVCTHSYVNIRTHALTLSYAYIHTYIMLIGYMARL